MKRVFLTAEWRDLIMANYIVEPATLEKYLPYKTELDYLNGKCYVSLVGFMFLDVRLHGVSIPFHVNFPEVNLRFYTRYNKNGLWKRGVVFIREFVPKPAIALIANYLYREKYATALMRSGKLAEKDELHVEYQWKLKKKWNVMQVAASSVPLVTAAGSGEEFITEHYWGYSLRNKYRTNEYGVEHPRWAIHQVNSYRIDCDFESVYGKDFGCLDEQSPESIFLAEGSEIVIREKTVLL